MNNRQGHAIVLKVLPHGESDKILTLYSAELGKISAIAKGAQRSKKRFVNKLEPFSLLQIFYRSPRNGALFFLSEAELIDAHIFLRSSYSHYVTATFIAELIQRFSSEHDPDPAAFSLFHWALSSLNHGADPAKIAALFLLRLLAISGYEPQLSQCGSCQRPHSQCPSFTLYPNNGTLLCSQCQKIRCPGQTSSSPLNLSLQTVRFLHSAQRMELEQLHRLQFPQATSFQALRALSLYSRHLLQQDIHSWKQLQSTLFHAPR